MLENYLINVIMIFLSICYSPLVLFFIVRLIFVLESLSFGLLVGHSDRFKTAILNFLFNKDSDYLDLFIKYFYGNPAKAPAKTAITVAGSVGSYAWFTNMKEKEECQVEEKTRVRTERACATLKVGGHTVTPTEYSVLRENAHESCIGETNLLRPISHATKAADRLVKEAEAIYKSQDGPSLRQENLQLRETVAILEQKARISEVAIKKLEESEQARFAREFSEFQAAKESARSETSTSSVYNYFWGRAPTSRPEKSGKTPVVDSDKTSDVEH